MACGIDHGSSELQYGGRGMDPKVGHGTPGSGMDPKVGHGTGGAAWIQK